MPAAMKLSVLVSLFAMTICADSTTSAATKPVKELNSTTTQLTSLALTEAHGVTSSIVPTTNNTSQNQITILQNTTAVSTEASSSSSPPPTTSLQTHNRSEETHSSRPTEAAATSQTSNETVSHRWTAASESTNVTTIAINITTQAFPHEWGKADLTANPGLVAILCIFCITIVLVLLVAIVKCIQSSKSNFERLEDLPMGNVNEESPFAHYSK